MAWLQIHIGTDKENASRIEILLEDLGALSVTLADAGDEPILELGPGETRLWQRIRLSALFPVEWGEDRLRTDLSLALGPDIGKDLQIEYLADQPWERAWLEHFRPIRFGGKLWIRPGDSVVEDPAAVVVDLDPGLAFGTGTHPTTALCLEWLEQADITGKEIIDFGCGSGILAIAALKLGAARVHAIDHDPQAILASRENAERNRVLDRLQLYGPGEIMEGRVDLVLANILSGTLVKMAGILADLARPGAGILLSGILEEQAEGVLEAYCHSFDMSLRDSRDGWVLLHGVRLG